MSEEERLAEIFLSRMLRLRDQARREVPAQDPNDIIFGISTYCIINLACRREGTPLEDWFDTLAQEYIAAQAEDTLQLAIT